MFYLNVLFSLKNKQKTHSFFHPPPTKIELLKVDKIHCLKKERSKAVSIFKSDFSSQLHQFYAICSVESQKL